MLGLKGYSLELNCCNTARLGGGVGAYIHFSIKYKVLKGDFMHAESIWLQTEIGQKERLF